MQSYTVDLEMAVAMQVVEQAGGPVHVLHTCVPVLAKFPYRPDLRRVRIL